MISRIILMRSGICRGNWPLSEPCTLAQLKAALGRCFPCIEVDSFGVAIVNS